MFVLTALVYPGVLALLCTGAGLLVDRLSGRFLPWALIPAVGASALIALSQLTTYVSTLASVTPYAIAACALAGLALSRSEAQALLVRWRSWLWPFAAAALAYVIALAPVLAAGRSTLSSYMTLTDSAVHLVGADFLLHHGQDFAHLDLRSSYGQYVNAYYAAGYPSGADTLFGASSLLLGLPLIWTFQPFNALMLALVSGPAWLLVRRLGLERGWAALATVTVTAPALVYAYELIGSVKEITALPLLLTLGALTVVWRRWLWQAPNRAIPFALVVAGGVSAVGVAFGAWALASVLVLLPIAIGDSVRALGKPRPVAIDSPAPVRGSPASRRLAGVIALGGSGAIVLLIGALPTWSGLSGSLRVSQEIASTANPGNLHTPLRMTQLFGIWLSGSYKLLPDGGYRGLTYALIALVALAAALGTLRLLRTGQRALFGWIALMIVVWVALSAYGTTWTQAKTLMLTSPLLTLLAWAGIQALRGGARRRRSAALGALLALALGSGALASDAMLYHSSDLAPTARYREMAWIDSRFAGRGPALFTDYDEYAMYVLRDLDIGGPNFIYPPPALAGAVPAHGHLVDLSRIAPSLLRRYPLIITRRDPSAARPPAAYSLLWQGTYYQVWGRRSGAPAPIARLSLRGARSGQCARLRLLAHVAHEHRALLIAAERPELVRVRLGGTRRPASWARVREGIHMDGPGRLTTVIEIPTAGEWNVWLQGQAMRALHVSIDGRSIGAIGGQTGGTSLTPQTMPPLRVALYPGTHTVSVARAGASLAPGDGGSAVLSAILLTPDGPAGEQTLHTVRAARWRSLCGRAPEWLEVVPRLGAQPRHPAGA